MRAPPVGGVEVGDLPGQIRAAPRGRASLSPLSVPNHRLLQRTSPILAHFPPKQIDGPIQAGFHGRSQGSRAAARPRTSSCRGSGGSASSAPSPPASGDRPVRHARQPRRSAAPRLCSRPRRATKGRRDVVLVEPECRARGRIARTSRAAEARFRLGERRRAGVFEVAATCRSARQAAAKLRLRSTPRALTGCRRPSRRGRGRGRMKVSTHGSGQPLTSGSTRPRAAHSSPWMQPKTSSLPREVADLPQADRAALDRVADDADPGQQVVRSAGAG